MTSLESNGKRDPIVPSSSEQINSWVTETVSEFANLPADQTLHSQNLFDDGLDSIGFIEIIQKIEAHFGIRLSDEELASPELATIAGIVSLISRHLKT